MSAYLRTFAVSAIMLSVGCFECAASDPPEKIVEYLRQTTSEALTPLWDNGYKPRPELLYGGMKSPLRLGMLGTIDSFKILQIVDEKTCRADVSWQQPVLYKVEGPLGKVFHKLELVTQSNVLITGISTVGRVDGQKLTVEQPSVFEVSGTRTYSTVGGGTRTIFVLTPFDIAPFREAFEKEVNRRKDDLAESERAVKEASEKQRVVDSITNDKARLDKIATLLRRKWTDNTGNFTTTAQLLEYNRKNGTVTLRKADDSVVKMGLYKLGRDDRKWLQESGAALLEEENLLKVRVAQYREELLPK